jgi:hypothetical protein
MRDPRVRASLLRRPDGARGDQPRAEVTMAALLAGSPTTSSHPR